eukprot:GABW01000361.1.p2 GENE.GABW01000361.1~~GABW01000361.1.p2  ORF type:complete len:52 (+),score=19.42 GABW01000361.1:152-307(+)
MAVYSENMRMARKIQASSPNAEFGETKFSDMTHEEWSSIYLPTTYDAQHLV